MSLMLSADVMYKRMLRNSSKSFAGNSTTTDNYNVLCNTYTCVLYAKTTITLKLEAIESVGEDLKTSY